MSVTCGTASAGHREGVSGRRCVDGVGGHPGERSWTASALGPVLRRRWRSGLRRQVRISWRRGRWSGSRGSPGDGSDCCRAVLARSAGADPGRSESPRTPPGGPPSHAPTAPSCSPSSPSPSRGRIHGRTHGWTHGRPPAMPHGRTPHARPTPQRGRPGLAAVTPPARGCVCSWCARTSRNRPAPPDTPRHHRRPPTHPIRPAQPARPLP